MFVRAPDVIATDLQHEMILLDPRNGEMFALNETGRYLWLRLPVRSAVELAYDLEKDFDVDAECACGDVLMLMLSLKRAGLIVVIP
jgi:hypothetical protein